MAASWRGEHSSWADTRKRNKRKIFSKSLSTYLKVFDRTHVNLHMAFKVFERYLRNIS